MAAKERQRAEREGGRGRGLRGREGEGTGSNGHVLEGRLGVSTEEEKFHQDQLGPLLSQWDPILVVWAVQASAWDSKQMGG